MWAAGRWITEMFTHWLFFKAPSSLRFKQTNWRTWLSQNISGSCFTFTQPPLRARFDLSRKQMWFNECLICLSGLSLINYFTNRLLMWAVWVQWKITLVWGRQKVGWLKEIQQGLSMYLLLNLWFQSHHVTWKEKENEHLCIPKWTCSSIYGLNFCSP